MVIPGEVSVWRLGHGWVVGLCCLIDGMPLVWSDDVGCFDVVDFFGWEHAL